MLRDGQLGEAEVVGDVADRVRTALVKVLNDLHPGRVTQGLQRSQPSRPGSAASDRRGVCVEARRGRTEFPWW